MELSPTIPGCSVWSKDISGVGDANPLNMSTWKP